MKWQFWRKPPYWHYRDGNWHRRLDYRSPWNKFKNWLQSWRRWWWRKRHYWKTGQYPIETFAARYHAGWHFPFEHFGYVIRMRPSPTETPASHAPSPVENMTPTAREVPCEVLAPDSSRSAPPKAPTAVASPKGRPARSSSARSTSRAVQSPAPPGPVARPPERSIDAILHSLLHEKKWLTPAERARLNQAYQMEKHRAGLTQNPDPSAPIHFRKFVPPPRPPEFHLLDNTTRMWYCRMEELWQFRQEDSAKDQLANASPAHIPKSLPPQRSPKPKKRKTRKKS